MNKCKIERSLTRRIETAADIIKHDRQCANFGNFMLKSPVRENISNRFGTTPNGKFFLIFTIRVIRQYERNKHSAELVLSPESKFSFAGRNIW